MPRIPGMKLLYQTHSPYARKALVFAHEVGLARQIEVVHHETSPTRRNEHVFAENPLGKVPVLLRPGPAADLRLGRDLRVPRHAARGSQADSGGRRSAMACAAAAGRRAGTRRRRDRDPLGNGASPGGAALSAAAGWVHPEAHRELRLAGARAGRRLRRCTSVTSRSRRASTGWSSASCRAFASGDRGWARGSTSSRSGLRCARRRCPARRTTERLPLSMSGIATVHGSAGRTASAIAANL